MASRPGPLAEIEAAVWRAGARNPAAVERIMHLVRLYGAVADCPSCPLQRRAILKRAVPNRRPR